MTEYELDRQCEILTDNCMKCELFAHYMRTKES